jgi:cytoskeletal protein CcmA (bactofilin family)
MIMIISINMSQLIQLKSVYKAIYSMYMISCNIFMAETKTSILLSDVSIEGDLVEKDKLILDAKVSGDIKAEEIITHSKSNIIGNLKSKTISLGGKLKGNINSDQISIKKTADIEGVLNQKTLSIQEGAQLKIKTETHK